ncbi:hypothetical protein Slin15195_G125450 [Septoria linicola]|uniref:Uncharacterized protein n=1 Tax=Septoria linicola TaxID=215465 RepID=A0A9Q9B8X3_9PEZI|nr:hypothetical protein Slin14017_G081640 [Septoria linicola]USW59226.1 hypothetical protein Slin15195_G125450 [Septoria linicola]
MPFPMPTLLLQILLATLTNSLPTQQSTSDAAFKLIATSATDRLTSWSISHTATGSGRGLIALHSSLDSSSTAQLTSSNLLIDGYEVVLMSQMAQVSTYAAGHNDGDGNVKFSITGNGEVAVGGDVDGFWACPSIIVSSNEQVGGPGCASVPTPCAEEGSYTLWFGKDVGEEVPIKGCQKVRLRVS